MVPFEVINLKACLKNVIHFILFSTSLYIVTSCSSSRNIISMEGKNQEWKMVKTDKKNNDPSWTIYSRKLNGTNIYEYKIEGNIESNASVCLTAFREDIINQTNNSKTDRKIKAYKLLDESKDSLLTYTINNEPFPFKDTEMCTQYQFSNDSHGNAIVKWNEAWDKCIIKPSKKLKRIDFFRGSWYFSPTTEKTSKAVNSVEFDPKGMPMWLVNPMVINFLRKGLENIREMTANKK